MGSHYVPQEYLRGFSSSDDRQLIWMFDKQLRQWSNPAISQVAQERGFYSPEIEAELNRQVEAPANLTLKIIRAGENPAPAQWADLILYVTVMLTRVPRKRRKGWEAVPQVLESTLSRFRAELEHLRHPDNEERINETLLLLDRMEAEYAVNPPEEVREQIATPWPSERVAEVVGTMTWKLVAVPPSHYLVTSDNPAHFFESRGLGRPESELTFPLAPHISLMGSRQGQPGSVHPVTGKRQVVKEINRRIVSGAERFVFAHRKAAWVETVAANRRLTLNRIQW